MKRLMLLGYSLRYTRPSQIWGRGRLMVRRKTRAWLARRELIKRESLAQAVPSLGSDLPRPLFPPRLHLVERDGDTNSLLFLNQRRPLTLPMEWHPAELETGTRLGKLNLHYMEFLEALSDELWPKVVADWVAHNPPYRPGYWLDNWNSYALSIRCVVWMQQYAARGVGSDARMETTLTASLAAQLRFLARNLELDVRGNHLIKNIKALLWAGRFFEGAEPERWSRLGERLLLQELAEQVLADGMHFERAPAYHAQVFADLLECYQVVGPGPARTALTVALDRMAQALVDLTHPDGAVSLFNDGGLHMTYPVADCLRVYTSLTGKSVEARPEFALEEAGYFGLRAGSNYFLADCGMIAPDSLPAHGHGDILAFEWTRSGRRIVVDAGVYEYNAGPLRAYSRSTRSHNTVTVADEDQCEFWSAFRVARRARVHCRNIRLGTGALELDGSHDGYRRLAGAPRHTRRFAATPDRIEVRDGVDGGAGQPVRARLLLHPDCLVVPGDGWVRIESQGVVATLRSASPIRVEEAWWSPDFGVRLATKQLVLEYGSAPCTGEFTLEAEP